MKSLLSLVLFGFAATLAAQQKVPVTLYYESLCPDSIAFIVKQLYPTWVKMGDYMDVELIPYGNAREHFDNKQHMWVIECQHGEMECKGNKMAACAVDQEHVTQDQTLDFVNCLAATRQPDTIVKQCAAKSSLDYDALEKCYNGQRGIDLLLVYANMTHSVEPKITWVPTIAINNVFDPNEQDILVNNLSAGVCKHFEGVKPSVCNP